MPEIHLYSDIDGTLNESPFVYLQQLMKLGKDENVIKRTPEFYAMLANAEPSPFYKEDFISLYAVATKVVYHSGRDIYHRVISKQWLTKHGIYDGGKCALRLFPFTTRQNYLERKYKFLESEIRKNEKADRKVQIKIFDDDETLVEWLQDYITDSHAQFAEVHLIKGGKL